MELERLEEPRKAQFMEDVAEDEEASLENIACAPDEGVSHIYQDYKIKAANIGKVVKPADFVETMKNNFKFLRQLYRWEESINKANIHVDKLDTKHLEQNISGCGI
ncbi:hypothetical protein Trydic_g17302 [Trypoxylus dichotomus]